VTCGIAIAVSASAAAICDAKQCLHHKDCVRNICDGRQNVAYEATRLGTVEFSQTYMLLQQSFLVLDGSPIKTIADIDRADRRSPAQSMIRLRCA